MKLSVDFPSVFYREGAATVAKLAQEIERIGFDQLDMFDHVVMGYNIPEREDSIYPAKMPILEALMTLSYFAAVTHKIGLGTEVLVLPQREPTLVAKQVSTLDILSEGRVRLGVGVGWQSSEYEAQGENFKTRGRRMEQAITLLRTYWHQETIDFDSRDYYVRAMAMEPKPPQGKNLPIWMGGHSEAALKRVGKLADGWLGSRFDPETTPKELAIIRQAAKEAGRDPAALGLSIMLSPPPRGNDQNAKNFFKDLDQVAARLEEIQNCGFGWASLNMTAIFQSGSRHLAAMVDHLGRLHDRLRQVSS